MSKTRAMIKTTVVSEERVSERVMSETNEAKLRVLDACFKKTL